MGKREQPPALPDLGLDDAWASYAMIDPVLASETHPVLVDVLVPTRFTVDERGQLVPTMAEVAAWLALDDDERARRINRAHEMRRILGAGYTLMRGKATAIVIVRMAPLTAEPVVSATVGRLLRLSVATWSAKLFKSVGGDGGKAF